MNCNVCGEHGGELSELGYKDGDTYEMFLCTRCRTRFIADTTVQRVGRIQAP